MSSQRQPPLATAMLNASASEPLRKVSSARHWRKTLRHECIAEFIGTAVIIVFGCGVVAASAKNVSPSLPLADTFGKMLYINTGWGLAVTFGIMASFDTSGAHLNSAVTLNAVANGSFPLRKGICFMMAQLSGAFFGAVLVTLNFVTFKGESALENFYCTHPAEGVSIANAALNEFLATFLLQFSILGITNHHPAFNKFHVAGFVGALVFAIGAVFGPLTGYAINPARDLGPRLCWLLVAACYGESGLWDKVMMDGYFLVPIFMPCLGAVLAGAAYRTAIYVDDGEQADEAWAMEHLGDTSGPEDDEDEMS